MIRTDALRRPWIVPLLVAAPILLAVNAPAAAQTPICESPTIYVKLEGGVGTNADGEPGLALMGTSRLLEGNKIRVPAGEIALVNVFLSMAPTGIRFYSARLTDTFQPVAPNLWAKVEGENLLLCDYNMDSLTDHVWSFGVQIDGGWYDPQIENDGSQPGN